ncbi:methyl-CpG-binding domain-containing protein 2-like [Rutidosis leptorrhynchoides]|uniref:methyl-CpG-binding domain-containing protein 2-like n=1 Tax=Rutidosis leptorrhynchoides TaxID=125765 RepID=UPI003A99E826
MEMQSPFGNASDQLNMEESCFSSTSSEKQAVDASKQLVLYEPVANSTPPSLPRAGLPPIGAFAVQCANCYKWRLMPTVEKYEEIREHILERPFYCKTAQQWRPDLECEDPTDISQDGSRIWAIDKPSIAQTPAGWNRSLRIRSQGSSRFADVYYEAPTGKRFRSMVEVQKFLMEHPEYLKDGVTLSQFSFQTPRPLEKDYLKKRPSRATASNDSVRHLESVDDGPYNSLDLQLVGDFDNVEDDLAGPPRKKQA